MRKAEMESAYKRIKVLIAKDPEITDKQLTARTGIGYRKVAELRAEVEGHMKKTFEEIIEDLKRGERKDELTASPVEHRVMSLAFMAECVKKFERRAEEKNRTLKPWEDNSTEYLCKRQLDEVNELFDAVVESDPEAIMDECLDVANFAWFIYEQAKAASETGA